MKLIFCKNCGDIVKLTFRIRKCFCKLSKGKYQRDGLNAFAEGPCVPIGILNTSFLVAVHNQPVSSPGFPFDAVVIEKDCGTFDVRELELCRQSAS